MRLTAGANRGVLSPALPVPYPALENAGLRIRRGQASLTVAASGVGKSNLWANIAHRMKVPTLYWSADTDQHDVTVRACALWSGLTTEQAEAWIAADPEWTKEHLAPSGHIDWVFDAPILPKQVGERVWAFAEVHGQFPHLVVIDNISDSIQDRSNEYAQLREVVLALKHLARETKAHVAMLHHAKGEYETGIRPIPQAGSLGNLFRDVEVGLTLHRGEDRALMVNLVKIRGGKSDPAAQHPIALPVDFARAAVMGFKR